MERKNAWKGYDEAKSAKVDALAKDYMDFLDILAHVLTTVKQSGNVSIRLQTRLKRQDTANCPN